MVSINQKTEKKERSAIIGGRCGVLVQVVTYSGHEGWEFFVKNSIQEARESAAKYADRGLMAAVCRRCGTNYKNNRLVSVNYRLVERLIPHYWACSMKIDKLGAGGFAVVVFNAKTGAARWVSLLTDAGERSDDLDGLALGPYNGRAVWC